MLNKRFGKLICIKRKGSDKHGAPLFECRCDCGTIKVIRGRHLRSGQVVSCGCLHRLRASKRISIRNFKHGAATERKPLYAVWVSMRQRCNNVNSTHYHNYGGRGISVCAIWDSFATFRDWAFTNGYKHGLQIDRINNDGNYEPSNCRWVTCKVNALNKRTNRRYKGKTLEQWSLSLGGSNNLVKMRFDSGWDKDRAIAEPPRSYVKIDKEAH